MPNVFESDSPSPFARRLRHGPSTRGLSRRFHPAKTERISELGRQGDLGAGSDQFTMYSVIFVKSPARRMETDSEGLAFTRTRTSTNFEDQL